MARPKEMQEVWDKFFAAAVSGLLARYRPRELADLREDSPVMSEAVRIADLMVVVRGGRSR